MESGGYVVCARAVGEVLRNASELGFSSVYKNSEIACHSAPHHYKNDYTTGESDRWKVSQEVHGWVDEFILAKYRETPDAIPIIFETLFLTHKEGINEDLFAHFANMTARFLVSYVTHRGRSFTSVHKAVHKIFPSAESIKSDFMSQLEDVPEIPYAKVSSASVQECSDVLDEVMSS